MAHALQSVGSFPYCATSSVQLAMGDRPSLSQPDAEGHLQLFRQGVPNIRFEVVFDLPSRRG
ncbi:hypothetical protein [Microcoleus sp. POL10_C6]|uniref:hypothetical protein n=1 Tax=Microcoleus sp. POL10_C6 TaxID=2818852 RepID=UPI002FD1DF42